MGPFNGSYACVDCGTDTRESGEWYMVKDSLWVAVNPGVDGVLCIGCIETRLGRPLVRGDFILRLLDLFERNGVQFSERLLDRLAR